MGETGKSLKPRVFVVSRRERNQALAAVLARRLATTPAAAVLLVRERCVRVAGRLCTDPNQRLSPGQPIQIQPRQQSGGRRNLRRPTPTEHNRPRHHGPRPTIRHVDDYIVVVDKPAGLTTMRHEDEAAEFGARAKRFLPPTLQDLLPGLLAERGVRVQRVFAVHRLDRDTSGLVVFARTPEASSHLGRQFRGHTTERRYLALVRGRATAGRIESCLVADRGDGRRGSGPEGARAVTHVEIVEELGEYTLVACRLETGRTHQVRIHLAEAGTPLCGEHVYDRPLHGRPLPDGSNARRILLHAQTLGFTHPGTEEIVRWNAPLPTDLTQLLDELRRRKR